jgi:hypothetical protein
MEVQQWHERSNEADNITEPQHAPDYFTNPSRYFNQPPTPSGATVHDPYSQPDDDMCTRLLSFEGIENSKLDANPTPMCLCPHNACSCPFQHGLGQEQRLCLPPAAIQFKSPGKILRSDPVLGNWDPDEFSMSAGLETDGINLNWDDETFRRTCL